VPVPVVVIAAPLQKVGTRVGIEGGEEVAVDKGETGAERGNIHRSGGVAGADGTLRLFLTGTVTFSRFIVMGTLCPGSRIEDYRIVTGILL
jgi:hypothetical protein